MYSAKMELDSWEHGITAKNTSKNVEHAHNQYIKDAAKQSLETDSTYCKRASAQLESGRELPAHRRLERPKLRAPR